METTKNKRSDWSKYYENQKKLWFDPNVNVYVKSIVRIVELHRSDSKGWNISVRRVVSELGISKNTVMKYISEAIDKGYLETDSRLERKRRKLRLSVSLRAPIEFKDALPNFLSFPINQAGSDTKTESVAPFETINSNTKIKAIINESQIEESSSESLSSSSSEPPASDLPKITKGYQLFQKTRKELDL